MRVLLTGGYGCIGSWIIRNLLDRGDEVVVYDLRQDFTRLRLVVAEADLPRVGFAAGDVTDLPALRRVLREREITNVIHLAGLQVPVCRADPLLGAKVNVLGTLAVFEAVRELLPQIQRVVYASSGAVFGPPALYRGTVGDDALLMPSTHYGVYKQANEGNARVYFQDFGLSSVGLRPWTVYGVGRDFGMTSEPTKAIKSVVMGRSYAISYGGYQDMQLADDVAKAFIRAAEAPYQGAKSYNLRGQVVSLAEFHAALSAVDTKTRELVTFGDRQLQIHYDLSDDGFQRDLGPLPATPLADGVRRTYKQFLRLHAAGMLDDRDLVATAPPKRDDE